nr:protein VAPYRIN-like [Hydra vulgaris]
MMDRKINIKVYRSPLAVFQPFDESLMSKLRIRAKSFPEELLRESFNTKNAKNGCYHPPAINHKRLMSCGEIQTALVTMAIQEGNVIQLWRLLSRKDSDPNHVDGFGLQPIHYACMYGELDIIKILLQHSVDVNAKTLTGENALDIAVKEGNFEVAQYLINKGAYVTTIVNGIKGVTCQSKETIKPKVTTGRSQRSISMMSSYASF